MNENIKKISTEIIKKLTKGNIKKVNGIVGIVDLTCDIVEETSSRLKQVGYKLTSNDKKELAFEIITDIVIKLRGLEIIDDDKSNLLLDYIDNSKSDVDNIIEDVISIFNDNKQIFKTSCNCFKRSKKILRKFELI